MSAKLSFYFPWTWFPREYRARMVREFLDNGVNTFVFTDGMLEEALRDPEALPYLRKLTKDMGVSYVSAHGLCGQYLDLDVPEEEYRPKMIENHRKAMAIAAEFGSKTYTIHVGAYYHVCKRVLVPVLHEWALRSLDLLVPEAEKLGLVLAVENSFEPPNTPDEVVSLIKPYLSSPAIGACYDTGHANCMAPADWKKKENYPEYQINGWWEKGIITEAHALEKMTPYIVTTHIHDNDGYCDLHGMPGDGTIDWKDLIPRLKACSRMLEYQTEVVYNDGTNWAGKLLAPPGGYSIRRNVEVFRALGFDF